MRKTIAMILALTLALACCAASFADDPDEIPGTVEMPYAGLRFVPPELYQDTAGRIITEGEIQIAQGAYCAYWLYCAMTEDELNELYLNPEGAVNRDYTLLFYVFSVSSGMTFDELNAMLGYSFSAEYAREIGKVGNYTFYLYMDGPDQDFAETIGPAYRDEYLALAGAPEQAATAFTCYEPVDRYAALIGSRIEFMTTDIDGNPVSSGELFAQNEITMVNIWATWCGPCINELAELQQIHLRLSEKGCGVVGLLDDTDLDSARRLIADNGVAYPVILGPDNLYELFPIEAYPSTFFVGRDGTVLAAPVVGAYVDEYENMVDSLLHK